MFLFWISEFHLGREMSCIRKFIHSEFGTVCSQCGEMVCTEQPVQRELRF
jgi:hypothetical protein